MTYDIFISYRRKGGWETAKHLYDLLDRDHYRVSFDIDTLRNGDFDVELLKRVDECTDFVLILNKGVFDRCFEVDKSNDWLRCELAYALEKKKNIIPIMLEGFTEFPDNLPDDIARVARKNGPKFDMHYFDAFYSKLKNDFLDTPPPKPATSVPPPPPQCILKILSNMKCSVWVDGKYRINAVAGVITRLPMNKGSFLLEFFSVENIHDKYRCEYTITDPEQLLSVDLASIVQKRKRELEKAELVTFKGNKAGFKYGSNVGLKYGFKDKATGNMLIQAKYDFAGDFHDGLAAVQLNGKWGYIDKTEQVVIPLKYEYDYASWFTEGLAEVKLNGKWGFVDKTGKEVIPLKYDETEHFSEGLAAVKLSGKWGFIDKTGKEVIPLKYDYVCSFLYNGTASVMLNGKGFYIDKSGNRVR